jgi:hypothetical protein
VSEAARDRHRLWHCVLLEMDQAAKILGGCWLLIGMVYYAVLTGVLNKPAALEV